MKIINFLVEIKIEDKKWTYSKKKSRLIELNKERHDRRRILVLEPGCLVGLVRI